jgi:hypothetical protein
MQRQNLNRFSLTHPTVYAPWAGTLVTGCWPAMLLACVLISTLWHHPLTAETLYRSVNTEGRISFSDKPPADPAAKVTTFVINPPTTSTAGAGLPFELRQIVSKFPVTLYSASTCVPCDSGRNLLLV